VSRCVVVSGVRQESHQTIRQWNEVGVSYGGEQDLIVIVMVCVCLAIIPGGIWDRTWVWHRKARHGVRVLSPEHVSRSLLRYPQSRSQTLDGGLAVKWFTGWAEGLGMEVPLPDAPLVCGLV
jgi:hypothetical protein